jgi:endonuclease/exonuclease/phosphatase family metal-dependent hydrolase
VDARQYPYLHATGLDQLAAKGWFRVELRRRDSDRAIRIINTHFQSDYDLFGDEFHEVTETLRMKQARQLASVEQKEPTALIVGDFNTDTCWIPGCQFLGAPLTALPYTFPPSAQHLDHLASWVPDAWRVLEHTVFERIAWSDHVPVRWTVSTASRPTHR